MPASRHQAFAPANPAPHAQSVAPRSQAFHSLPTAASSLHVSGDTPRTLHLRWYVDRRHICAAGYQFAPVQKTAVIPCLLVGAAVCSYGSSYASDLHRREMVLKLHEAE